MPQPPPASNELSVSASLDTASVSVRNMVCHGGCAHSGPEECAASTYLVFPYRGVYVRHVGRDQAVADANHVVFFNADEGYRIAHPVAGSDASLSLQLSPALLEELAPAAFLNKQANPGFRMQHRRIDTDAQALVASLRHGLEHGTMEALEAEGLLLDLVTRSLGPRNTRAPQATEGQHRLANRVKLLLSSDLSRRWSLADVGAEIGASPVYLTQVFQRVEGLPLYRYQLRLRLARALDLMGSADLDLSALAADLGFSSHSHFTAAFRQAYGQTPADFRRGTRRG
ncbi:helix-turn-helix domain-containing protein [Luteibacter sp. NPDC031894]|uniref:helix-turn-helix domain-containing protein n=1 Tax=Luteibacter sp. NPDC031894 TaxID=3390572 RepID=UPI003D00F1D2